MSDSIKKMYKKGFYGGKFLPFHTGHAWCIEKALESCNELYVLLFVNTNEENRVFETKNYLCPLDVLMPDYRIAAMKRFTDRYPNVHLVVMDCDEIYRKASNGNTWEMEVPFVLKSVGDDFEVVFSSEPSYDTFFRTHYPWADHVLIDPSRQHDNISGTMIREGCWEKNKTKVL